MSRRILSLLLISVLFSSISICQVQVGIKGGINYAEVFPIPALEPGAKWTTLNGVVVGAIVQYSISEIFSLQVEASFVQKGFKFHSSVADGTEGVNYLEIPIGFKIIPLKSEIRPYFFVGAGLAAFLNAREKAQDIYGNSFNLDTKDNYKSGDYTGQLGVGLQYLLNSKFTAFVEGRYSTGFTTNRTTPGANIKTTGIAAQIGILYAIN